MRIRQAMKLRARLLFRLSKDLLTRDLFRFPIKNNKHVKFRYSISITQEIKPGETFDNKLFNLLTASNKINQYSIMPNEVFSFWHAVGNPYKEFKASRTIRDGKVVQEAGGGLCQASGILYLSSLIAGLPIVERHNHSIDLYTDETRFAPLGSDATVVYGYKDFRIRNRYKFPIKFELQISNNILKVSLLSTEAIKENLIYFRNHRLDSEKIVETLNAKGEVLTISRYNALITFTS